MSQERLSSPLVHEFFHKAKGYAGRLVVVAQPPGADSEHTELLVANGGKIVGIIKGRLTIDSDGKSAFYASISANMSKNSLMPYVPGAVSSAIAQLVITDRIQRWYSDLDSRLSDDAHKMYGERLSGNKRLNVIPPSERTYHRYVVEAKPQRRFWRR